MKPRHSVAAIAAIAALACAGLLASTPALAASVVVDVTGAQSINLPGEQGNTVWWIDIGANAVLTSLDWTVTLNAFAPSSRSEMQVSFGSASGADLLDLRPGLADGASGSGHYAGSVDLTGLGVAAGPDGKLRLEFSETFKDFANGVSEGQWASGTLTFGVSAVPEPASALPLLAGLGVLGARLRRSRLG